MIVIVKFKKLIIKIYIFNIIIRKFNYYQNFHLVILFIINKNLKIRFYNISLFF